MAQAPTQPGAQPQPQWPSKRKSATLTMSPALQALQQDDAQNPAMLWAKGGQATWVAAPGASSPSCARCHGDASQSMRGVAARHPRVTRNAQGAEVVTTLSQSINRCRVERQLQAALPRESEPMLQLETLVALHSRGVAIAPPQHQRLDTLASEGAAWFERRIGQLNLSCAQCHDERSGGSLGGSKIPQGHPTGYPVYRLEWQGVGSLNRRMRACMVGVRAEPFAPDAPEWVALEVYLMRRAAGMVWEAPAVRP